MDRFFTFEEIHVKALLKILNFLNQEFLDTKTTTKQTPRSGKGRPSTKIVLKPVVPPTTIETIDATNRQLIIESVLNCCQYFDQYFKFNYKFVVIKTDNKITKIQKWLQNYYKKEIIDHIDFDIVIKEFPKHEVIDNNDNKVDENDVNKDTNVENVDNNDQQNNSEIVISEEISSEDPSQPSVSQPSNEDKQMDAQSVSNTTTTNKESFQSTVPVFDEELNANIIYNLELILLLVSIIFYKVRNLFPKFLDYLEFAWIYLQEFETRLEAQVEIENLIELLQNEFISQRNANKMRSEVLSNELIQLNAMIENLEKQYEDETRELIYLQNATIIGHNSGSGHSRQLSRLMNMKSGPPREQKIYTCPECGKQFKNGYKLNRHQYVHRPDTEKPFCCDWPGCGYRSIANNDLNRHKMIHTGEKPFSCDVEGCERKYSRPDKLSHHKKMVHAKDPLDKKFACDWPGCGYRSTSNSDLMRHHYIHTGERPFKCDFMGCDKAFSRPDKLRNHKDKVCHNNLEELLPTIDQSLPINRTTAISIAECVPQAMQWT